MSAAATTWGLGDYPLMAERLEGVAARAVSLVRVARGDRVLDVACGTGNGALLAAARGAVAVGVDIEPALLSVARSRAGGGDVAWVTGDAAALPVPDRGFDVVLSIFGVMYAPDQVGAARELARVTAPGGRLALAAWVPGSFMPAMGGALGPYLPPPPAGGGPPSRWGDEAALAELLTPAGLVLEGVERDRVTLEFGDRAEAVDFLVRTAGHLLAERDRLTAEGRWDAPLADLDALVAERASAGPGGVSLGLDYLLARGRRAA